MLISSKYKDYYDSITAYGVDKSCVYTRNEQFLQNEKILKSLPRLSGDFWQLYKGGKLINYTARPAIIGFCGDIFPVVSMHNSATDEYQHLYDMAGVVAYYASNGINPRYFRGGWSGSKECKVSSEQGLKNIFNLQFWEPLKPLFQKYHCPIFLYKGDGVDKTLVLNPVLREYRFAQIRDPATAFQQIYMYLSGVLGAPPKELVEISDKYKAEAKGHGSRYSFRKPPGKKVKWR